jgi:hypothetical protein
MAPTSSPLSTPLLALFIKVFRIAMTIIQSIGETGTKDPLITPLIRSSV